MPWSGITCEKSAVCRINFKQYDESAKPESEVLKALQEQDSYQPGVAGMAALQEDRKSHRTIFVLISANRPILFFLPFLQHTIFGFCIRLTHLPRASVSLSELLQKEEPLSAAICLTLAFDAI